MKLSRIYSNLPAIFPPIDFNPGLNVVLGQIREANNQNKDTHNLGKSTLTRLLDFCLLAKRSNELFLFAHMKRFQEFIFFLELDVDGQFLTIRRSVSSPSKVAFIRHSTKGQGWVSLPKEEWGHSNVPFERAKSLLDGYLNLRALGQYFDFRKPIGYALRRQSDYDDVFQLSKFRGSHGDWKPYLAHVLGFDASLVARNYELVQQLETQKIDMVRLQEQLPSRLSEVDKFDGLLQIRREKAEALEREILAFNFDIADKTLNKDLVEKTDRAIATLNSERYYLSVTKEKIEHALRLDKINFDPNHADRLWKEAGLVFPGQLKKSYKDLIAFNKAIAEERAGQLQIDLDDTEQKLEDINQKLTAFNEQRSGQLATLSEDDVFRKYKDVTQRLTSIKAELQIYEQNREVAVQLSNLRGKIASLQSELLSSQAALEQHIHSLNTPESRYSSIRRFFAEIVRAVIDKDAIITTGINEAGNLQFRAEIVGDAGPTGESSGHSYKKLLCIAFDLAVARAYAKDPYPHFIYHDGALETLDDRKKRKLIEVLRTYTSEHGVQEIITVIDSDLPYENGERFEFEQSEVVRLLHDQGDDGRLFRMPLW